MQKTITLLLAAGQSKRLGQPKQLLVWKNKTLIEHAIDATYEFGASDIYIVLGGNKTKIEEKIKHLAIKTVFNPSFEQGMGTSLAIGVQKILEENPETEQILVLLSDQPLITTEHLKKLYATQMAKNSSIVATKYDKQLGVPAIFDIKTFPDLLILQGDKGAKALFEKYPTENVPFEGANLDIDTQESYNYLLSLQND